MTTVTITDDTIEIKGHSNYNKNGLDIVCASVSTAVYFLVCTSNSEYEEKDGYIKIACKGLNKDVKETFIEYVKQLEGQYKDYIRLV